MAKIPFTVSARTAKLIGQENFANAEGAIVELVKNAYDADASACIIIFDNQEKNSENPALYIIDNGVGMSSEIIKNHWMKIGTDDKLQNYQSGKGRVKTGAKGIGRFALDRLGHSSKMYTVSRAKGEGSIWSVEWSDFEKLGIAINEVKADLLIDNTLDFKSEQLLRFQQYKEINQLIKSTDFSSGTILEIYPLKDNWGGASLKSLFDNLEVLIPPIEQPDFEIHLFETENPEEFGQVNTAYYDDFDYKVSAKYLGDEAHTIKLEITRDELEVNRLEDLFGEVFERKQMLKFPYDLQTFQQKTYSIQKTIKDISGYSSDVDRDLLARVGEFEFTFYFLKNQNPKRRDRERFPYKSISPANRKAWLQKFGGVKIFRDDFRVRPYGENGQDWLGLGERQGQSPGGPGQTLGGYKIGPNQVAGTVKISRIANVSFQDKSGREGIIENDVFDLFKNILLEIIGVFERDRNVVMYNLSELYKQKHREEEERRKAQEEAERILREQEEANQSDEFETTERDLRFARTIKSLKYESEEKDEEIKLLRGLASVGLIISSFAHELKSLRGRLGPRNEFLVKELKKYISKKELEEVHKEDNPFYMLQLMQEEDVKLKHWLEYSLSGLKRDKRTRKNINLGEYFEKFCSAWNRALTQRKVKIFLKGTKNHTNTIRAFEVDLDAIFNNLLSNSLNALKKRKEKYQKKVFIEWKKEEDFLKVVFSDNGYGLDSEYKADPYRIFEYNESSKKDRKGNQTGTGMGLYIAKLVIDDYNKAEIEILPVSQGFSMQIKLPVRKDN